MLVEEIFKKYLNPSHKKNALLLGVLVAVIGISIGKLLFPSDLLPAVFFTTMPLIALVDVIFSKQMRSRDIAIIYGLIFIGMIIAFIGYYTLVEPINSFDYLTKERILQQDRFELFSSIMNNNIRLIFISFLLSMLYGIGSIFILTLNASIISQMFSSFIVSDKATFFYLFLPHTALEFVSYFLAAISGALLTVAIIKYRQRTKAFDEEVLQAALFFSAAMIEIILAALVESFLMPALVLQYA
ncbi:MAG: stage II sporulation protein M [Candidatus Aenigmatarchaeota archaeon]